MSAPKKTTSAKVSEPPAPGASIENEKTALALKEIFNPERFSHVAEELSLVYPQFKPKPFMASALENLDALSLMERLRRLTDCLRAALPEDYEKALDILMKLAPKLNHSFVTLALSDFVSQHGQGHFEISMSALKFFTPFGSAEFGVREFIRRQPQKTLKIMQEWSTDADAHVRRLASEGSRPRLPWGTRLTAIVSEPELTAQILDNLRGDASLYVKKSVANHLNDIAKDHPDYVMSVIEKWPKENPHTEWIARHALRVLIKKGDRRALSIIGAGEKAAVRVRAFAVAPRAIRLGETISITVNLASIDVKSQKLVIDYRVHYVRKSGQTALKVFKMKELILAPKEGVTITRDRLIKNFSTRQHHAGRHEIELLINGEALGRVFFDLTT